VIAVSMCPLKTLLSYCFQVDKQLLLTIEFSLAPITCPGNHAFIGLGLNKREDAFDLKSCLSDIEKSAVAQEKGVDLGIGDISNDLLSGLGTGTNITLKVGKVGSAASSSVSSSGMGSLLRAPGTLAPPGSSGLSVGSAFSGSSSSSGSLLTAPKPAPTKNEWETF